MHPTVAECTHAPDAKVLKREMVVLREAAD
jgi:hypothetical protein